MRRNVIAWTAALALLPVIGAGTALAEPVAEQSMEQTALSGQSATSDATSTQFKPTNTNISVRVMSDGDNGAVTQSNTSSADSTAGNHNSTDQFAGQFGAGDGGGAAVQEAAQQALNLQKADADATSKQIEPKNTNISVRVLSDGDDGDVTQSNDSSAESGAFNHNATDQKALQHQAGGSGAAPVARSRCDSGCEPECTYECPEDEGIAIQALGQKAISDQEADSDATSIQWGAKNLNAPVSIGDDCGCSDGKVATPRDGGDVDQSNNSSADAKAKNDNATDQGAAQVMRNASPIAIQALGQKAMNLQHADADALSFQVKPANLNLGGSGGGAVTQSNDSSADAWSGNRNWTDQHAFQLLGGLRSMLL